MQRLKQRADFLAAAAGIKVPTPAFVVQTRARAANDQTFASDRSANEVRVGFTVTKKIGNAVERNRIRRRLREVVRLAPQEGFQPGHDYVLIGRRAALTAAFGKLTEDFSAALTRLHTRRRNNQKA